MTDPAPILELMYEPGHPGHFIARLGRGGWLESFGWTEQEALEYLAASVIESPPEYLPAGARGSAAIVLEWFETLRREPILNGELPEPAR